jgi:hypothetical protein
MNTKVNFKQSILAALKASLLAAAINAVLFFIFHALGLITDDIFIQPGQVMTVVPVLISSIVPTLIAGIVFFVIEKYTKQGLKIFSIISVILLLLSFMNPFLAIQGVNIAYGISLNFMHIVVVAALLYFLKSAKSSVNKLV